MKLIKIPSGQGGLGHGNGAAKAPDMIMEQTKELFLNEDKLQPIFEVEQAHIIPNNFSETNESIMKKATEAFSSSSRAIFLGGDHSITFPIVKAAAKKYPGIGLLVFDAHPDCENDFAPPSQEDIINGLINQGIIAPERILLVGLRNWDRNEIAFIKEKKIPHVTMKQIMQNGISEVINGITESMREWPHAYVSIDIDVLDPAFAPGTGYREPGGLSTRELLTFIQRIKLLKNVRAFDIVEVNPEKDVDNLTTKVAAKILWELYS
ncbi:arginase family protein [Candidatus Woesearchaeota archaeon]|nr:MAG: arginase [archaeon GW2011_AR4]MBS3129625.1 arginase family protein [Candidatus Woesearchaeota archaeon]HIH37666.1 arginase family protein [Candidatus Woesearchaeota archaeon]HIH48827.1 arginase family protein [Candidatus Woesearchaeota archaeon]HIJ02935.1 arginase family protein [Candidatus Woesearchaeota archaeon]